MNQNKTDKIINVLSLIVVGIVLFFTIVRIFFGVDLTDEAYAVAETYMVSEGALPFVNNWSQMPGFTLILAPFIKIYTLIAGGTDGIFLFYRFLSLFINVLTAFAVAYLLKEHIKNKGLLALLTIIYVGASGWDYVVAFRGDNLAIDLLAVGVMLIIIFFADERYDMKYLFISGVLLALAVLSYPALVIEFPFFAVAVFVLCYRRKMGYKAMLFFVGGAALAASIVIGYLAINSGLSDIFIGIRYLLEDVAYFQLENEGVAKLPAYLKDIAEQILRLLMYSAVVFASIMVGGIMLFRKKFLKRNLIRQIALLSLIAGICLYHGWIIWQYKAIGNIYISLYAVTIETLAVPLVYFFIRTEKRICKYFMWIIWLPSWIWSIVTGIEAYSAMERRHRLFENAAFLLGLLIYFAIYDNFLVKSEDERKNDNEKRKFTYATFIKIVPVFFMMVISFTHLSNAFSYVYRDKPISLLDTVVAEGPYKGMRTTKDSAEGVLEADRTIDCYVDKDDYILAMDNNPAIYLMSEGKVCTPSTWDQALYSYNFDQPDIYYDYFKITETEPSKIIYFHYGRDEIMSIDVEYQFNDYVRKHYDLIYENRNIFEWNYLGKDINCQLLIFERK